MNDTTDTGWTCGTCGRLNFSHRTACKVCKGTVRATTTPSDVGGEGVRTEFENAAPSNQQRNPSPWVIIFFVLTVVAVTGVICVPLAFYSMIFSVMAPSVDSSASLVLPMCVLGLGMIAALAVIVVGVRWMTPKQSS